VWLSPWSAADQLQRKARAFLSRGFKMMWFAIVGEIRDIEPIALGRSVRVRLRLRKLYGGLRWRKLKGIAEVRLPNGTRRLAEVRWYESHGIGCERRSKSAARGGVGRPVEKCSAQLCSGVGQENCGGAAISPYRERGTRSVCSDGDVD
jgi:hypothetical protein